MKLHSFETKKELEDSLLHKISSAILQGIEKRGKANILLSGGNTPVQLYHSLADTNIDWSDVNVGLVDERFVSTDNPNSNELLIKTSLLKNVKANDSLTGMVFDSEHYEHNLKLCRKQYEKFMFHEIDFCLLGMGDDGHTASLFPNDKHSEHDLKSSIKDIINTYSPNEPKKRITCSRGLILSSDQIAVMIAGKTKMDCLTRAKAQKLPISYFFQEPKVEFYYTEEK